MTEYKPIYIQLYREMYDYGVSTKEEYRKKLCEDVHSFLDIAIGDSFESIYKAVERKKIINDTVLRFQSGLYHLKDSIIATYKPIESNDEDTIRVECRFYMPKVADIRIKTDKK